MLCSITIIICLFILYHIWPLSAPSHWLLCLSFFNPVVFRGTYFLEPQDVPNLSCTSTAPAVESVISLRSSGSFNWRRIFRNQNMGTKCACCFCGVLACSISQWTELENICMHIVCSISGFCVFFCLLLFH